MQPLADARALRSPCEPLATAHGTLPACRYGARSDRRRAKTHHFSAQRRPAADGHTSRRRDSVQQRSAWVWAGASHDMRMRRSTSASPAYCQRSVGPKSPIYSNRCNRTCFHVSVCSRVCVWRMANFNEDRGEIAHVVRGLLGVYLEN